MSRETYRADLEAAREAALDVFHDLAMRALARELVNRFPPKRPKPPTAKLLREDPSTMALIYGIEILPPVDPDVVKRTVMMVVNGGEPTPHVVNDPNSFELPPVQPGDSVSLTLIDTDDAGLDSEPSAAFTFFAADTLPPARPGAPTARLLRETVDTPEPEPTPEGPPV
jgi:hypothetical protein